MFSVSWWMVQEIRGFPEEEQNFRLDNKGNFQMVIIVKP